MRVESPVGCPRLSGDPAEEKTVPDGSTGLFTNMLDCFRVLISARSSDDASAREVSEAAGKSTGRAGTARNDAYSIPATQAAAAGLPNGSAAHAPVPHPEMRGVPEAGAPPTPTAFSGLPFSLTIPGFVGEGEQARGAMHAGSHQGPERASDFPATAKPGAPAGPPNPPEVPTGEMVPPTAALLDATFSSSIGSVHEGQTTTSGEPPGSGHNAGSTDAAGEAAEPGPSTTVDELLVPPVPMQAATAAMLVAPDHLQPGDSSSSDRNARATVSMTARSTRGTSFPASGNEVAADFAAASATAWIPRKAAASTKADMNQPAGRSMKTVATSQAAAAPEERAAYARLRGLAGGTDPMADAGPEAYDTVSSSAAHKRTDKTLASTMIEPMDRNEPGQRTDFRPAAADSGSEPRSQSQRESAARPAVPLKTAVSVDSATAAVELEKITAGRGRLSATFEGSASEVSAGTSLSALARDTQASAQASAGVKDMKAPAFVFEVAERISTVIAGGRGEITVQLRPDEFGRMNIVAESGASGILARITTESSSLKQYLESNLPVLQQALQDQGLKVERIDVVVQEGLSQQQSAGQWQQNFGHAPGGRESDRTPGFAQVASAQPGEPVNEITLEDVILGALHPNSTFHTIA